LRSRDQPAHGIREMHSCGNPVWYARITSM
jgi:hypothetical protein